MISLKYSPSECNYNKLEQLLEHYQDCDYLVRLSDDLKRRFERSSGIICLEKLHAEHLFEAYWYDIGGES
jgi:hypothetical protein